MTRKTMGNKIHKDCPFSRDEINEFKAMLYMVNTANECCNAAPFTWIKGYQNWQVRDKTLQQ